MFGFNQQAIAVAVFLRYWWVLLLVFIMGAGTILLHECECPHEDTIIIEGEESGGTSGTMYTIPTSLYNMLTERSN